MNWQAECAAVIPCLNEEATIAPVIRAVRVQLPTVIVVDDGSTDRTAELARGAGAEVLTHERTAGKGRALLTGWRQACARGFRWALTLDGDGQHSPSDIPAFFQRAESTSAALIVGNRMAGVAQMPWLRRFVNRWMSRRLSTLAGRSLPDSQCGFRLMSLEAWSALTIAANHFEIESEILLAFVLSGHLVEFVPIQVIYKNEQSKIHPLPDTIRWFRWWRQARAAVREKRRT